MAPGPVFAYTTLMHDKVFIKELGFVIALKLLLLFAIWFLFFHQAAAPRAPDLRAILLDKDPPA